MAKKKRLVSSSEADDDLYNTSIPKVTTTDLLLQIAEIYKDVSKQIDKGEIDPNDSRWQHVISRINECSDTLVRLSDYEAKADKGIDKMK